MAIVQAKSQRWRLLAAHLFLLCLCAAVVFPFLVVLSVSLRPGNFASGSLIPQSISLEHWRYVLGLPYIGADGKLTAPDLPVLLWLWNSIKVAAASACVTICSRRCWPWWPSTRSSTAWALPFRPSD